MMIEKSENKTNQAKHTIIIIILTYILLIILIFLIQELTAYKYEEKITIEL